MSELLASVPILASLLDELPLGVVVLNAEGRVIAYNRYEEVLACRKRETVLGKKFFSEVAPCLNVKYLGLDFEKRIHQGPIHVETEFEFALPFLTQPRDVYLRMVSFNSDGNPYACLLVEDVSARRAVERMKVALQDLLVHDLKNPLAVTLSSLRLLKSLPTVDRDREAVELANSAVDAGQRLQRMVVNLLDITRLETAAFPLERVPTDLRWVVEESVQAAQALARMQEVHLESELPYRPLMADADPEVMRRALDNLIENALRYTPPGKGTVVRGEESEDRIVLEVEDQGPGIPEELRERVFEKHVQIDEGDGSLRSQLNRGLGLTFVRLVARAHGGDARVECPSRGGSIFRLEIPKAGR